MSKLEQVVSLMVNSTSSATSPGGKLPCWSDDSRFRCREVNGLGRHWRESFHQIRRFDKQQRGDTATLKPTNHPGYEPIVSLCDILKLPQQNGVNQAQFLDYFELSTSKLPSTSTNTKYYTSHPRTLVNSPHVPFSSNIGLKLIKDWHSIPEETHIKKLERVERYLRTDLEQKPVHEVQYEVTFNKTDKQSHNYLFPTKSYHRTNKLTPEARHLLKKYCRPCSVHLTKISAVSITPKPVLQKENFQARFEPRIILTNYFPVVHKENSFERRPTFFKELRPRKKNVVLKTLTPQNQNSRGIVQSSVMCENLINASVILSPINNYFGLSAKTSPNKLKTKIRKIGRSSNFFGVRRISPRLNIRGKPLKII